MHCYRWGNFKEPVPHGADNSHWYEMIGIQSTANQVHENGLNGRVPYDVGRSINTWQSTPIVATAHSIAKLAGGSVE